MKKTVSILIVFVLVLSLSVFSYAVMSAEVSNGQIIVEPDYEKICPLKVSVKGESTYLIYLEYQKAPEDSSDSRMAVKSDPFVSDIAFIVLPDSTAEVEVPVGVYKLYYCSGDEWNGPDEKFGENTVYSSSDDLLDFYTDSQYAQGHALELWRQAGGNFSDYSIDESTFPGMTAEPQSAAEEDPELESAAESEFLKEPELDGEPESVAEPEFPEESESDEEAEVEEVASSPILFRSIPWGISASDFSKEMEKQGIAGKISNGSTCSSWEFVRHLGTIEPTHKISDVGFSFRNSSPDLSVSAFEVSVIDAWFLPGYDEEGVYPDEGRSSLYKARYVFDVADGKGAYEILSSKLSTLYGEGVTESEVIGSVVFSTNRDYRRFADWTVWYGAENTGVVLLHEYELYKDDGQLKSERVHLTYGKTDSLEIIGNLEATIARLENEKAAASDDFEGL